MSFPSHVSSCAAHPICDLPCKPLEVAVQEVAPDLYRVSKSSCAAAELCSSTFYALPRSASRAFACAQTAIGCGCQRKPEVAQKVLLDPLLASSTSCLTHACRFSLNNQQYLLARSSDEAAAAVVANRVCRTRAAIFSGAGLTTSFLTFCVYSPFNRAGTHDRPLG
jgi:hypothetical protein